MSAHFAAAGKRGRRCEGFHGSARKGAAICGRSATGHGGTMTPANINSLQAASIWHATRWRRKAAIFMTNSPHQAMAARPRLLFVAIFDKCARKCLLPVAFVSEW
ncbi:hypothetical protein [Mesorhizobium sp. WSM3859]|uniref:hypothetical protein n=1 Tax=Mesorhizobium sp. WSM3859 TaxID=2029402 RepID=UPI001140A76A|nr:hypothetical protein [Mesorhizobium sp. WSM3859]